MDNVTTSYDKEVLSKLDNIQKIMNDVLDLNIEKVELASLKILSVVYSKNDKTKHISDTISKHLEAYNEEYECIKGIKHYITPRQFLVPDISAELNYPDLLCLPVSIFEQYKIVLNSYYSIIHNGFNDILSIKLDKRDAYLIKKLDKSVKNLLVDNVNLQGNNPYYKRNVVELVEATSWWKESLNRSFNETKLLFS